ncbi:uncharacterized protein LOC132553477 [Ylistrum balloti]|uniref:uncharacterized protein LOC132553477 n=1 Tax=Ylistrum balloti TaxID=509963 RepID=UPI002905B311|nr:uncharacterized protein LOC132553477 [Ylistrum balloti]
MATISLLHLRLLFTLWCYHFIGNCKGDVYRNFTCVTFNWDEYITCSWTVSSSYHHPAYYTTVTWRLPPFAWYFCPKLTSNTCTWSLGGNGRTMDVDPHQSIRVCLILKKDNATVSSECHNVSIENKVKPATVTDLIVIPQHPNCIFAQWTHEEVERTKKYYIEISSAGLSTIKKNLQEESFYDYYDSPEFESGTNFTICNLLYYVNYTVSVTVSALDDDLKEIGYQSDPLFTNVVTMKSVPSGPPYLHPGGYTLSAVNSEGYRMVRVYWEALPNYKWNGENKTYEFEALPIDGCGSRTMRLSVIETWAEFDILYTCNYNIRVWTRNERGRSKESGFLSLQQHVLPRPRELFMTEGYRQDIMNITWLEPNDISSTTFLTYTVYWCPQSPRLSCEGSFKSRTVDSPVPYTDGYFRTNVKMDGYPNVTYIYGVSTDGMINGTIVSSGFAWTDCSLLSSDNLKQPKISFQGFPSEQRVRVTWIYMNCAETIIRKSYITHFDVTSCLMDNCNEFTVKAKQLYVDLFSIAAGQHVCVSIAVRLNTTSGPPSASRCYTQSLQDTWYPWQVVLVSLVSLSGVVLVVIAVAIFVYAMKWWRKTTNVQLPEEEITMSARGSTVTTEAYVMIVDS